MESRTAVFKEVFVGAIVGIASMLPGISGATMCVVFGIYERIIRDLAHLREWIIKDISFIFFLFVGLAVGTVLAAKVLDGLMASYPVFCLLLFVGLIVGQLPMLMNEVRTPENDPVTSSNLAAFAVGLAVMAAMIAVDLLGFGGGDREFSQDLLGICVMFLIGIVIAVSMLLPGLSHSTILVVLGLFSAFTSAVSNLNFGLLIPMGLGAVAAVLMFSKILHRALDEHHRSTMFLVIGLTIGSIASVLVTTSGYITDPMQILLGAVAFAAGMVISFLFARIRITEEA